MDLHRLELLREAQKKDGNSGHTNRKEESNQQQWTSFNEVTLLKQGCTIIR